MALQHVAIPMGTNDEWRRQPLNQSGIRMMFTTAKTSKPVAASHHQRARGWHWLSGHLRALLLLAVTAAHADVLPPQAADASERFRNNPRAFDRYDTWCEGRSVKQACRIPGNTFEGGGVGVCERNLHRTEFKIDLRCQPTEQVSIERGFADGPWMVDEQVCKASSAAMLQSRGWVCDPPPRLVDRFCTGRQPQSVCTATLVVQGVSQAFEGICQEGHQSSQIYFQGRRTLTRPTLSCEPKTPTPTAPLKDVTALQKLWQ